MSGRSEYGRTSLNCNIPTIKRGTSINVQTECSTKSPHNRVTHSHIYIHDSRHIFSDVLSAARKRTSHTSFEFEPAPAPRVRVCVTICHHQTRTIHNNNYYENFNCRFSNHNTNTRSTAIPVHTKWNGTWDDTSNVRTIRECAGRAQSDVIKNATRVHNNCMRTCSSIDAIGIGGFVLQCVDDISALQPGALCTQSSSSTRGKKETVIYTKRSKVFLAFNRPTDRPPPIFPNNTTTTTKYVLLPPSPLLLPLLLLFRILLTLESRYSKYDTLNKTIKWLLLLPRYAFAPFSCCCCCCCNVCLCTLRPFASVCSRNERHIDIE